MASEIRSWTRQGEAFWRAHHDAWKRSDLNQRQYCEADRVMTLLPPGVKVHLALGYIDMRKGIDGLAMLVQSVLSFGLQNLNAD
jgi:hypothetical protein